MITTVIPNSILKKRKEKQTKLHSQLRWRYIVEGPVDSKDAQLQLPSVCSMYRMHQSGSSIAAGGWVGSGGSEACWCCMMLKITPGILSAYFSCHLLSYCQQVPEKDNLNLTQSDEFGPTITFTTDPYNSGYTRPLKAGTQTLTTAGTPDPTNCWICQLKTKHSCVGLHQDNFTSMSVYN